MHSLIAVDPGLRHCGIAYFYKGILGYAGLVRNPETTARGARAWIAMARAVAARIQRFDWEKGVVEDQEQYEGASNRVNRADLTELAHVAGAVALVLGARGSDVESPLPKQWKGQLPKDVCNRRIEAKLTPLEAVVIEREGALTHNIIDAVGLGLWALKRF